MNCEFHGIFRIRFVYEKINMENYSMMIRHCQHDEQLTKKLLRVIGQKAIVDCPINRCQFD